VDGEDGAVGPQGPLELIGPAGPEGPQGSSNLPPGTIIELRAGTPPPAGFRLILSNVSKSYQSVKGGRTTRVLVDVYEKE